MAPSYRPDRQPVTPAEAALSPRGDSRDAQDGGTTARPLPPDGLSAVADLLEQAAVVLRLGQVGATRAAVHQVLDALDRLDRRPTGRP